MPSISAAIKIFIRPPGGNFYSPMILSPVGEKAEGTTKASKTPHERHEKGRMIDATG
jgi:hypothetical protein